MKKDNKDITVIVGMSGGVDSSVCAALLKEQGYKVIGMFMKNWEEFDENGVCQSSKEFKDVVSVCEKLDIPYYSIDFVKEYRDNVFKYFLEDLENGLTPNPDILCNREIKFKVFFEKAMELGADYLATGHYCQNINNELHKGFDDNKDQSYFLYTIKKEVLNKVMFPIGHLQKMEVRKIAEKYGLITHDKKDSTGICFIGERNFNNFISNYVKPKKGSFRTLNGDVVGNHSGAVYFTIGQRKGLGLGGQGEPWFVIGKDIIKNDVYVERGEKHLFSSSLKAKGLSLVNEDESLPKRCKAKIRYRGKDEDCTIILNNDGSLDVNFDNPQRAITPGQSIVFYDGDKCLGGAFISLK